MPLFVRNSIEKARCLSRPSRAETALEEQTRDQAKYQPGCGASCPCCEVVWNLSRHDLRGYAINGHVQAGDVGEGLKECVAGESLTFPGLPFI